MEKLGDLAKKKADEHNRILASQSDARIAADVETLWQLLNAAVMDAAGQGRYVAHIDAGGGHEDNDPHPEAWKRLYARMKSEKLSWEPLRSISNKPGGMVRLWVAFGPLREAGRDTEFRVEPGEVPKGTIHEQDSRPIDSRPL